jgi:hypothetical protein
MVEGGWLMVRRNECRHAGFVVSHCSGDYDASSPLPQVCTPWH